MNSAKIPSPINEPVLAYAPGSPQRSELKQALKDLSSRQIEIPVVVGDKEIRTGKTVDAVMPHCHRHVLGKVHQAGPDDVKAAIKAAREAWRDWSRWSLADRAAVFLKAAALLATRWRAMVNAATMLGQSKTAFQAEIDAACELIDFWRFNVHYAERIYAEQPVSSAGTWNALDYRALEVFVYATTPFTFTSIGGTLPTSPAIMGCTVVWKPAATAAYSNYLLFRLLQEAGLPPGVINFIPGPATLISENVLGDRHLGGIHFTGSTEVFQSLWKQVANNLTSYAAYPRVGRQPRGQGLHSRARECRRRRARDRHRARRVRVPGTEVQRRIARVRAAVALAERQGARARPARQRAHGRPGRLPQLHGGGDR